MEPIEKLRAGDADAIDWLVDTYSDRLLKTATVILGDRYAAVCQISEEMLQYIHGSMPFLSAAVAAGSASLLVKDCSIYPGWF